MDPDARAYLGRLVSTARRVVGANLVGAYAAGSLALDDYVPGRSDINVALVTEDSLTRGHKERLVSTLRHDALPCPARGLELVVYRRAVARSGTRDPGFELELNTGPHMPFRATFAPAEREAADGTFWYALDRSILHQSGQALLGPPAADVFAELPEPQLRETLVEAMGWWLDHSTPIAGTFQPRTDDAVLGACRAVVRLCTGVWLSKAAAAHRLLDEGLDDPVVAQAVDARRGGPRPSAAAARAFQQWALTELQGRTT